MDRARIRSICPKAPGSLLVHEGLPASIFEAKRAGCNVRMLVEPVLRSSSYVLAKSAISPFLPFWLERMCCSVVRTKRLELVPV